MFNLLFSSFVSLTYRTRTSLYSCFSISHLSLPLALPLSVSLSLSSSLPLSLSLSLPPSLSLSL